LVRKAFVFERTGDPNDVLAVRELLKPKPGPGEILVRVRLSPVHPSDMHIMRGRFGRQPTLPASPGGHCELLPIAPVNPETHGGTSPDEASIRGVIALWLPKIVSGLAKMPRWAILASG
jgi:hypothetical protein